MITKNIMAKVAPIIKKDVFLGGSCNPTTWRIRKAIPFLEKYGISYYNPQVDDWSPELMKVENYHKDTATVLLFVIDNETRAIASCTEAAYYIGKGRKVVIVVNKFITDNSLIINDSSPPIININEYKDLNRGRDYLIDICKQHNITVHNDVESAMYEIKTYIYKKYSKPSFFCFF